MNQNKQFPFVIQDVETKQAAELMKYFTGEHTGFVRVGPKGYFLPNKYRQEACNIYNMPLRDSDIFVASYPRSDYWTPYFENIKEAWDKRHHPNLLFLFYEDISKNLPNTVRLVAPFLNKQFSEDQVACLCEHLSIDNFRKNKSINYDIMKELGMINPGEQPYIRKGKAGGWCEYFDEDMKLQAERWIAENLQDTDLRFPDSENN